MCSGRAQEDFLAQGNYSKFITHLVLNERNISLFSRRSCKRMLLSNKRVTENIFECSRFHAVIYYFTSVFFVEQISIILYLSGSFSHVT